MAYVWAQTIANSSDIDAEDVHEIRTNINTERTTRAGLGAYVWANTTLEGEDVATSEALELRTAIDAAYDLLWTCATHYASNDGTHDTTVAATHYTTHDGTHDTTVAATHYTTDDGSDDATHYASHDVTVDATAYGTHNSGQVTSRMSSYLISRNAPNNTSDLSYNC